jgi:hypothetical protein
LPWNLLACNGKLPCNVIFLLEGEKRSAACTSSSSSASTSMKCPPTCNHLGWPGARQRALDPEFARGVVSFELRARRQPGFTPGNWGGVAQPIVDAGTPAQHDEERPGRITIDGTTTSAAWASLEHAALANCSWTWQPSNELGWLTSTPVERPFYDRLAFWPT